MKDFNKITRYNGYIIMSCGLNSYRLFKNDLLLDQYNGSITEAKKQIDILKEI